MMPSAFQYDLIRALRPIVVQGAPGQRVRFGLGYEDLEVGTLDGTSWSFVGAFERTQSPWGWGVLLPGQNVSLEGVLGTVGVDEEFWQGGVMPYVFSTLGGRGRAGGFVELDFTSSDLAGIGDVTSYAAGAFCSAQFEVGENVTIAPAGFYEHYWTGQDGQDDSDIFTLGPQVEVSLGGFDLSVYGFFTLDTTNDALDGTFWEYGATVTFTIAEGWGITIGYEGTAGADEFDSNKVTVDAQWDF